ncbi:MAG: MarR family transcriptional regulator [Desulfovibrio sp.]|nr:MarR family transcriptional regulator [Desulfovibrio sp.]
MTDKARLCAERLLAIVPTLMQSLRVEMRAGRSSDLTVPQFRILVFFQIHPGAPLTQAAEHLGLSLPAASKLAEGMVGRGLLGRETCASDRRRISIALTPAGQEHLAAARRAAVSVFTGKLSGLTDMELDVLFAVLGSLQKVCGIPGDADGDGGEGAGSADAEAGYGAGVPRH